LDNFLYWISHPYIKFGLASFADAAAVAAGAAK
jgi:hypothetical protein